MIDINVPPLRFPDFKGEWEKDKASALLECFPTNSITWEDLNFGGGTMRDLHYGLIHKGFNKSVMPADSKLIPWINSGKEPKKYTKIKDGDLILADASEDTNECGKPVELFGCLNSDVVSGLHTIHCRDKKNFSVPGFKAYLFQSGGIKKQLYRLCEGTKIYSISPSTLDEVILHFPVKKEQQRIVDFLNSLEDRILLQRKIIEDITLQKKSIRSRCFNLENGPFANQRWMSEPISSFLEEQKNKQDCPDGNRLITVRLKQEGVVKNSNFENLKLGETQYYTRHVGEFIYGKQNLFNGAFGIVPLSLDGFSSSGDVPSFSFKGNINPIFFLELIATEYKKMEKYSTGTGSKRIHENQFLSFNILVPNGSVQNKIVCVLASLSKKEELEKKSLSLIESAKSYLLSALFC